MWTDPSSLSCADLKRGNENNEQKRAEAVWLLSNWAPLHHGTQDRQTGHKGPSLPGLFTLQGEREQRAAMMMDEGAAGALSWTGLKRRSKVCGQDWQEAGGVGSMIDFVSERI